MKSCRYERHAIAGSRQDRGVVRPHPLQIRRQRALARLRRLTTGCAHPPGGRRCTRHGVSQKEES